MHAQGAAGTEDTLRSLRVCSRGGVWSRGLFPDRSSSIPLFFFFSSRRRHTRFKCDWSSDVCSSDLIDFVVGRRIDQPVEHGVAGQTKDKVDIVLVAPLHDLRAAVMAVAANGDPGP